MEQHHVSCDCGTKLRIVFEPGTFVQVYCDRCNRKVFPQETMIGRRDAKGYTPQAPTHSSDIDPVLPGDPQGLVVDNYRIAKRVGSGSMGTVYLAIHTLTREKIVIKVLNMDIDDEEQDNMLLEYFIREAQILMELDHPNIVKFKGCGNFQGRPYMAMEYIDGEDLRKVLGRGAMKFSQAIYIVFHLASALEYAHNMMTDSGEKLEHIHRDIKPSNIILARDQKMKPKLIDFGLAKSLGGYQKTLTEHGAVLGTPHYMPKEQVLDARDADHRSDIYSLGATFYHMLAGKAPFGEYTHIGNVGIMEAIVNHKLSPLSKYRPNCPRALLKILDKMMACERENRYSTATELKKDLKVFIENLKK